MNENLEAPWKAHRDELYARAVSRGRMLQWRRRGAMVLSAIALIAIAIPVVAMAAPGGKAHGPQVAHRPNTTPVTVSLLGSNALALGDDVMLSARGSLARVPHLAVDAAPQRQFGDALEQLDEYKRAGALPLQIVVHLGNNGPVTAQEAAAFLDAVPLETRVHLMTVLVPQPWENEVNQTLEAAVRGRANARVAEWRDFSEPHAEYFAPDGAHLSAAGQAAYAAFVAQQLGVTLAPVASTSTTSTSTTSTTVPSGTPVTTPVGGGTTGPTTPDHCRGARQGFDLRDSNPALIKFDNTHVAAGHSVGFSITVTNSSDTAKYAYPNGPIEMQVMSQQSENLFTAPLGESVTHRICPPYVFALGPHETVTVRGVLAVPANAFTGPAFGQVFLDGSYGDYRSILGEGTLTIDAA